MEGRTLAYSFVVNKPKDLPVAWLERTAHDPELLDFEPVVVTGREFELSPLGRK